MDTPNIVNRFHFLSSLTFLLLLLLFLSYFLLFLSYFSFSFFTSSPSNSPLPPIPIHPHTLDQQPHPYSQSQLLILPTPPKCHYPPVHVLKSSSSAPVWEVSCSASCSTRSVSPTISTNEPSKSNPSVQYPSLSDWSPYINLSQHPLFVRL